LSQDAPQLDENGPNAAQIEYWNDVSGPRWVEVGDVLDAQISPLGLVGIDAAAPTPGERVLDVGCGCGQTTLQLAQRVGADGFALGLDLSQPMLARARERALAGGVHNVQFEQADAQIRDFSASPPFDLVFSRFGVMFFADPVAAFSNLRRALAPGGRIGFVCWREFALNPWMSEPMAAVAKVVTPPERPAPGAPGPFSLADAERLRGILEGAGFVQVTLDPVERKLALASGGTLDDAVRFTMNVGPVAATLREAGPEAAGAIEAAVRESLAPHQTPDGVVLSFAVWVVGARA
jgi:ubiquinone/menaquinone biosynthesis C-methylase UbiE